MLLELEYHIDLDIPISTFCFFLLRNFSFFFEFPDFLAEQTLHPVAATSKAKGNKKRINYASVTCGAKIVAANQEAQNPHFMLIENKDQYMINPCKARKMFVQVY